MNKEEIMIEVQNIFRTVFDDSHLVITDSTNANDIDDWDSLEQINIILTVSKKFNVKFEINEVSNLKNVGEIVDLIYQKIDKK